MAGIRMTIFSEDDSPRSIKHAQIDNWSGQAVSCPRSRLAELQKMKEVQRPAVYFLLAKNDNDEKNVVYVGKTANFSVRINDHKYMKNWWNEVIVFTNMSDEFRETEVEYLECRLYNMIVEADRYEIDNKQPPKPKPISKSKKSALEEYIGNMKHILRRLEHNFLKPVIGKVNIPKQGDSPTTLNDVKFYFKGKRFNASGIPFNKEFTVFKGSKASIKINTGLQKTRSLREKLITDKVIEKVEDRYIFLEDYNFSSSSAAAKIISGASVSGPGKWKDESGLTLNEVEQKLLQKKS